MTRVYFYRNGIEMKDCKWNGRAGAWFGCAIRKPQAGEGALVRNFVQVEGSPVLTVDDFGGEAFQVKSWYPGIDGKGYAEWFTVDKVACETCMASGMMNCPDHK